MPFRQVRVIHEQSHFVAQEFKKGIYLCIGDETYETHTHALRFVVDIVGSTIVCTKAHGYGQ